LNIHAASHDDTPLLIALDRASATSAHWTEAQYRDLFTPDRLVLGAWGTEQSFAQTGKPALLGFLVAHQIACEWELENIVVDPQILRKGIGSRLLGALLEAARRADSKAVFLEVRESNHPARFLYEKAGFGEIGRRKSYYSNPLEDAILYRLDLP
jgi:ribosomal-protein-alanine N-acetyltransferase